MNARQIRNELITPGTTGERKEELLVLLVEAEGGTPETPHLVATDPVTLSDQGRAEAIAKAESLEANADLLSLAMAKSIREGVMAADLNMHTASEAHQKLAADGAATTVAQAAAKQATIDKQAADLKLAQEAEMKKYA